MAFDVNAYIIICLKTGDSVLIDAPSKPYTIMEALNGTRPQYILLTHSHIDHIGALQELRAKLKIPVVAYAADAYSLPSFPEMLLEDGNKLSIGQITLEALHTPGHTPGSLCFKVGQYLISGDTIFPGGPGRTWLPEGFKQIIKSITDKILVLPDETQVYPGHGAPTILKKEKEEFAVFASRPHDPNLYGQVT
ncbi:MBL fold metallo-hydrolase [Chloroflexota bacterium]